MRRMRWVVCAALFAGLAQCGCTVYPFRAKVAFHETTATDGIRKVVVETQNGEIDVQGDAKRKDIDIQGEKIARGTSRDEAKEYAEKIDIEIKRDADRPEVLRIVARFPSSHGGRSLGASYRIKLPPGPALDLKTRNGHVQAVDASDHVSVETTNGRISVKGVGGVASLRTTNGAVAATDVAKDVEIHTTNGEIALTRVGHSRVKATTSNGVITARQVRGNVALRTKNGAINLEVVSLPDKPEVSAKTSNGDVTVSLPETVQARLRMRTTNGHAHADLKHVEASGLDSRRNAFDAVLNGGGGSIEIESTNGSVMLRTVTQAPSGKPK